MVSFFLNFLWNNMFGEPIKMEFLKYFKLKLVQLNNYSYNMWQQFWIYNAGVMILQMKQKIKCGKIRSCTFNNYSYNMSNF